MQQAEEKAGRHATCLHCAYPHHTLPFPRRTGTGLSVLWSVTPSHCTPPPTHFLPACLLSSLSLSSDMCPVGTISQAGALETGQHIIALKNLMPSPHIAKASPTSSIKHHHFSHAFRTSNASLGIFFFLLKLSVQRRQLLWDGSALSFRKGRTPLLVSPFYSSFLLCGRHTCSFSLRT